VIATANHGWEAARLRSSGDSRTSSSTRHILKDSSGFLNRVSQVRFLPGAPTKRPLTCGDETAQGP